VNKLLTASELDQWRQSLLKERDPARPLVAVCSTTGCAASGARAVLDAFQSEMAAAGLDHTVALKATGCHGFCERGPIVVIYPQKVFYQRVKAEDVQEIIATTLRKGEIVSRLLYTDPNSGEAIAHEDDIPFYKRQQRILYANNGRIDPTSIEDYVALGGYSALSKVLTGLSPDTVIDIVKRSRNMTEDELVELAAKEQAEEDQAILESAKSA